MAELQIDYHQVTPGTLVVVRGVDLKAGNSERFAAELVEGLLAAASHERFVLWFPDTPGQALDVIGPDEDLVARVGQIVDDARRAAEQAVTDSSVAHSGGGQ